MKNIEDFYPLSPMQQGILFHSVYAPSSGVYCELFSCNIHGELNISAFKQAWQQVIKRHSILRTSFVWEGLKEPAQVVHKQVELPWEEQDWREMARVVSQERIEAFLLAEQQQGFEISQAPLMRLTLIQLANNNYQFIWSHHHLLLDGWSSSVLLNEVFAFYKALRKNEDLHLKQPRPYRDYIACLQQRDLSQGETFWRERLQQFTPVTSFQVDQISDALLDEDNDYQQQHLQLSTSETAVLQSFAKKQQLMLSTIVQGAWAILLSRYSGEKDIIFGNVMSGRGVLAGDESIVGVLINTLPVRTYINSEEYLLPWLKQLQIQQNEILQYQYCPLIEIQKWSDIPSGQPLFQSILNFQNYPINFSQGKLIDNLKISDTRNFTHPHYPLNISFEVDQELSIEIFYNSRRFDFDTISRMLGHLQMLLSGIVTNPGQRLIELPILTAKEHHQLLVEWNQTQAQYPQYYCIHQLFEVQVERTPNAVAMVFEQEQLTYQELNTKANQLAHQLRSLGVGPEVLVGLYVERSIEMIIGLLGILKAGGAYVPIDPAYPQERLTLILNDAQTRVLLTKQKFLVNLPSYTAKVLCLDDPNWQPISSQNPVNQTTSANLAYVIYTSGSTGTPKGVTIQHQSLVNFAQAAITEYELEPQDRILQFASISFDAACEEIFPCLMRGATLVLRSDEMLASIPVFLEKCQQQRISVLDIPTAFWHQLTSELSTSGLTLPRSLRLVIIGGEKALPDRVTAWRQKVETRIRLINSYGPTETTVVATICDLTQKKELVTVERSVPIGRAIANIQTHILDAHLQPVPIGVWGEMYIGGIGVARGYLNQPQLTAQNFIPNPFSDKPGSRLYKTGDLVRYRSDGLIEFNSRVDNQVKMRGFRIELGEIEALLNQHPAVRETAVVVRSNSGNSQHLVAYVSLYPQKKQEIHELRRFLELKLPHYMMPTAFAILGTLPLTPSGKIDRKALSMLEQIHPQSEETCIEPQTTVEKQLAAIWAEVLGLEKIGINDNFFALGGDSILSLQVISKANQAGLHLNPKQLFQHQTIAQLAVVVDTTNQIQAEQGTVIGLLPLTPIQHWFFEQNQTEQHHWNQAVLLQAKQSIDPIALEQVIHSLQRHHDLLRLRFKQDKFTTQAVIVSPDDVVAPVTHLDLSALPKEEQAATIEATAAKLQASLNLSEGPLFQVALFDLGSNRPSCLLWVIHHLVVDGVSWRILIEDLQSIYQQIFQGNAIQLLPKTTSFKQWSHHLQEYAQSSQLRSELDYWLAIARHPVQAIPVDFPEGNNTEAMACTVSASLSVEETQILLQQIPTAYRTEINDVLLSSLIQTFVKWTGASSLLFDLEGHGREELFEGMDLSRTVGWFTSIFPVCLNVENAFELEKTLKSIKEQLRAIPNKGIGYGVLRYLSKDKVITEKLSRLPKPEVAFNYLGQFDHFLPQLSFFKPIQGSIGPVHSPKGHRAYLLEVEAMVVNGQLQLDWIYSKDLHRQDTIVGLAQGMLSALRSLITCCQSAQEFSYIPSDFPEAQLSQAELDKVFEELDLD
jgi:amino acid adenylation domain-containing protein/non-ribosomal peptide synthase protein (TIGR01720 family)